MKTIIKAHRELQTVRLRQQDVEMLEENQGEPFGSHQEQDEASNHDVEVDLLNDDSMVVDTVDSMEK